MSATASNHPCADPVREMIYENLSHAFFKEDTKFSNGTCAICGEKNIPIVPGQIKGFGACRAQASLTQKRETAVEGHPIAYGSPGFKPSYSLVDKNCGILVEDGYGVFTGKVLPTRPLPSNIEIRNELRFEDLLERVMDDPKPPYFLGFFSQKADMTFDLSTSTTTIRVNGTDPSIRLDRLRLKTLVDLVTLFGIGPVNEAVKMKSLVDFDNGAALAIQSKLLREHPELLTRIDEVPNGDESEFSFAQDIVRNRIRRAEPAAA